MSNSNSNSNNYMSNYYGIYTSNITNLLNKNISSHQDRFKLCNLIGDDKCYKVLEIIRDFIKTKKRIIYGGMAINTTLPDNEKIYSGENYDFDIYSSSPKRDIVELVNILNKQDIPYISAMESFHPGVYKLFIYFIPILDITYLPNNIIQSIPVFKNDGYIYPEPQFLKNDILLSLTNNIFSSYRWEKDYSRYILLNNYYPYERPSGFICERNSSQINYKIKQILEILKKWEKNENENENKEGDCIITLSYAYLLYRKECELIDLFSLSSPYVVIYHNNPELIIEYLINNISKNSIITTKRYEPFLRYFPKSVDVYWDDDKTPCMRIYNSTGLCIPYHILQNVKVVSLGKLLLDIKVSEFIAKIQTDDKQQKFYQCMAYETDRMNRTTIENKKINYSSIFSLISNKCEGIQSEEGFLIQDKQYNKVMTRFDYSPSKGNKFKYLEPNKVGSGSVQGIEAKLCR